MSSVKEIIKFSSLQHSYYLHNYRKMYLPSWMKLYFLIIFKECLKEMLKHIVIIKLYLLKHNWWRKTFEIYQDNLKWYILWITSLLKELIHAYLITSYKHRRTRYTGIVAYLISILANCMSWYTLNTQINTH